MQTIRRTSRRALLACSALILVAAEGASAIGDDGADGRFERRESLHFALYQDVDLDDHAGLHGSRNFEQGLLRELETAYDLLGRLLELRPGRKLSVTVWDPSLFDARFAHLFRFPAAGFYGGSIQIRGDDRITQALVRVLHHELVHAALDARAPNLLLPAWLNEGLAEWFEARSVGKRFLSAGEKGALEGVAGRGGLAFLAELSQPSLGGLAPDAASLAYLESYAFVVFLAGLEGDRGLAELCSAVLESGNVARGVRRVFRRDIAQLEAAFRRSVGAP